jgi:hypothetical protein
LRCASGPDAGQYFDGFDYSLNYEGGRPRWTDNPFRCCCLSRIQAAYYIRLLQGHPVKPEAAPDGPGSNMREIAQEPDQAAAALDRLDAELAGVKDA